MEWWGVMICAILATVCFFLGRFYAAWKKSGIPCVGKLIFSGKELYLNLDGIVDFEELRKYQQVLIRVTEVSVAKKPAAKME